MRIFFPWPENITKRHLKAVLSALSTNLRQVLFYVK